MYAGVLGRVSRVLKETSEGLAMHLCKGGQIHESEYQDAVFADLLGLMRWEIWQSPKEAFSAASNRLGSSWLRNDASDRNSSAVWTPSSNNDSPLCSRCAERVIRLLGQHVHLLLSLRLLNINAYRVLRQRWPGDVNG